MSEKRASALLRLFDETTALFHRLRAVAAEVHGEGKLSAGRRGILRSLEREGPQTVPQLARARPVSRQHIQTLVNPLIAEGLVAGEENPAHRRSPLLVLTAKGRRHVEAMTRAEAELLKGAETGVPLEEIQQAAATLGAMRRYFGTKQWREHVARYKGRRAL